MRPSDELIYSRRLVSENSSYRVRKSVRRTLRQPLPEENSTAFLVCTSYAAIADFCIEFSAVPQISEVFSTFASPFSQSVSFAVGLPEKSKQDCARANVIGHPYGTSSTRNTCVGMPMVSTLGYVPATCINCY